MKKIVATAAAILFLIPMSAAFALDFNDITSTAGSCYNRAVSFSTGLAGGAQSTLNSLRANPIGTVSAGISRVQKIGMDSLPVKSVLAPGLKIEKRLISAANQRFNSALSFGSGLASGAKSLAGSFRVDPIGTVSSGLSRVHGFGTESLGRLASGVSGTGLLSKINTADILKSVSSTGILQPVRERWGLTTYFVGRAFERNKPGGKKIPPVKLEFVPNARPAPPAFRMAAELKSLLP